MSRIAESEIYIAVDELDKANTVRLFLEDGGKNDGVVYQFSIENNRTFTEEMLREHLDDLGLSIKSFSKMEFFARKGKYSNIIDIKYHADIDKLDMKDYGDFIDLRSAENVEIKAGEFKLINLGVSMKLPDGYWAQLVPRSSLFKNHGLIQTNSFGVIDNSYSGDNDIWMMPVYATRDTKIEFNERIAQFRIVKSMNKVEFVIKDTLGGNDRGGFGSTGKL